MVAAPRAHASAPGKIILFGEHAVVYGQPSLSLAIGKRTHVEAEAGGAGVTVNGHPLDPAYHAYIVQALRLCGADGPVRLQTRSELPSASGVGSSAALSVATVAALLRLQGAPHDPARVAELAFRTEFETQGAASPNDTTVSTAGGGVLLAPKRSEAPGTQFLWELRRGEHAWAAHRVELPPLPLVVATTGRRAKTGDQVAKVRRFVEHSGFARDVVAEIGRITLEGVDALRAHDLKRVGHLMNRNHECLHTLGVDAPDLHRLVTAARNIRGAYGAKLTGAGGGGSLIALAEDPEAVRAALEALGSQALVVRPDPDGVRLEA